MTKEDVIEILERFVIGAKPCSQREIVDACASAYRMLKEHPSLPSNLDEAAEESSKNTYPYEDDNCVYDRVLVDEAREYHECGFKAGAEWMAGQGVIIEGRIAEGHREGYPALCLSNNLDNRYSAFNPGDKVVVQIRKK